LKQAQCSDRIETDAISNRGFTKLPKAEHDIPEWQAAMEALLLVVEHNGPTMFARIGVMRALNRNVVREFDSSRKDTHWGKEKLKRDQTMTVLIYVNTSKQVGDADHLKVFANADAAETWLEENDPEGIAFEYEVME
jgi:hypothetical protein